MNNDALIFAAIFIIAIVITCGGVVMMAFNRLTSVAHRRRSQQRTGHHGHRLHRGAL